MLVFHSSTITMMHGPINVRLQGWSWLGRIWYDLFPVCKC